MRPNAGQAVTPQLRVWMVLPPERRAAAVAMLALLAARAAAALREAGVMSLGRYRPWGQSQEKIRPEHRDRAAVVYVRQSSRQQVLEHSESTRLQYACAERAAALGWARSRVVVIDDDLGVSR